MFIAVDHCWPSASAFMPAAALIASRLWSRSGRRCASVSAPSARTWPGLALRRSWLSVCEPPLQAEIRFLGIASSPAFVREPEGNGCAERFIRVLKKPALGPAFRHRPGAAPGAPGVQADLNQTWIIERHGYRTPAEVRANQSAGCRWPHKRRSVSHNRGPVQGQQQRCSSSTPFQPPLLCTPRLSWRHTMRRYLRGRSTLRNRAQQGYPATTYATTYTSPVNASPVAARVYSPPSVGPYDRYAAYPAVTPTSTRPPAAAVSDPYAIDP